MSARRASGSVGKRRTRVRVVSRRRGTKSWPGLSIRNLTWAVAAAVRRRRVNLAAPRNCRLSQRELYEIHRLASGSRLGDGGAKVARRLREVTVLCEDDYFVL